MKTAKVYKVNIRSNILRQMVFTDTIIAIILSSLIGIGSYLLLEEIELSNRIKITTSLFLSFPCIFLFIFKIDRQEIYVVLFRFIKYLFRRKTVT
jgi:hypothetical protein